MKKQLLPIIYLFFWLLSLAPDAHGQWVKTNGSSGCAGGGTFASSGKNLFVAPVNTSVFLTTDEGSTWSDVSITGLHTFDFIRGLAIDSNIFSPKLFAATDGEGVWMTTNSGSTWAAVNDGIPTHLTTAVAVLGANLFVGTDQDSSGDGLFGLGAFLSTNSGASWHLIDTGLTVGPHGRRIWGFHFMSSTVLAGTDSGIFISSDTGKHWTPSGFPFTWISGLAQTSGGVFASTGDTLGLFRSTNFGVSWTKTGSGLRGHTIGFRDNQALASSRNSIFVSGDSGVFLSANSGMSWTAINDGLSVGDYPHAITVHGAFLFAGCPSGVWRRSLSEFDDVRTIKAATSSLFCNPNPCSISTIVKFTTEQNGPTQITIHNLLGTEVSRLFSGELGAGEHSFTWDARGLPPGMYECVVRMGGRVERVPMMVVR